MRRIVFLMVGTMLLAGGCVKKSQHEATLDNLAQVQDELGHCGKKGMALQAALDGEREKSAQLNQKIDELKAMLISVEKLLEDQKRSNGELTAQLAETIADKAKLKESTEELTRALNELRRRKAQADARVQEFKQLLSKFQELIDSGKLDVKIINGRMVLALPTDVLFGSGSASLSEEGEAAISEVSAVLATITEREFQVEGHTDNVPLGRKHRFENNWELAAARAMGVVNAMLESGMSGKVLSAASYGEYRPVASNDTPEGREQNRRIDIVIVPDLSSLPGFEELSKAVEQ